MTELVQIGFSSSDLKNMVAEILDEAKRQGATSAEVEVSVNKGFNVTVRKGEVETVEYNQDKSIGIDVFFGKRSGSASISDIRPEAIKAAVKAACNIARFTDEDQYSGLADKEMLAFDYPTLELAFPWSVTVPESIELAKTLEAVSLAYDKKLSSEGASISTAQVCHAYGNSNGFIGAVPVSRHEISCVMIAKKGKDMQRDYSYTVACDPTLLESLSTVAIDAAQRTIKRLGAKRLTTRRAPVIFAAEEARGLLGHFVSAISGGNLYRKSSFLLDHLDKPIFPSRISIHESPHLPKGLGSSPFDDDGVATRSNVFIEDGILKSYILGVYSARKLGMQSTGNSGGVHNLMIKTGNNNLSALLKKMGTGLLVTELMGQGVNIITGDYSRGCSGFWVENGEIQYPVEEITVAGNLRDMYMNLVEVGNDVDKRGNIQTGSILLDHMTIAGD
jgi:PmbA protein